MLHVSMKNLNEEGIGKYSGHCGCNEISEKDIHGNSVHHVKNYNISRMISKTELSQ